MRAADNSRSFLLLLLLLLLSAVVTLGEEDLGQALREASADGDVSKVNSLLAAGVYAGDASPDGETPLHLACIHGYTEVMASLIKAGGTVILDARSTGVKSLRMTPLTWCAYGTHVSGVEHLLEAGADPNLVVDDEQGNLITVADIADRIGDKAGAAIAELLDEFDGKRAADLLGAWKRSVHRLEQEPSTPESRTPSHTPKLTMQSKRAGGETYDMDQEEVSARVFKAYASVPLAVGSTNWIQYIYAKDQDGAVLAIEKLKYTDKPEISFLVPAGTTTVTAYGYSTKNGMSSSPPMEVPPLLD